MWLKAWGGSLSQDERFKSCRSGHISEITSKQVSLRKWLHNKNKNLNLDMEVLEDLQELSSWPNSELTRGYTISVTADGAGIKGGWEEDHALMGEARKKTSLGSDSRGNAACLQIQSHTSWNSAQRWGGRLENWEQSMNTCGRRFWFLSLVMVKTIDVDYSIGSG